MPLLATLDDAPPDRAVLAEHLAGLPPHAPVVVMIHGFRYDPADPVNDPHRHILALVPDGRHWGAVSWPRRLKLGGPTGLGVAWGWDASGSIWRAHGRAAASAGALARLIAALRSMDPDRPLHIIAHSLGARVALLALPLLGPGAVDRIILIAAAASAREAQAACASVAGRTAEVVNIQGRENRVFDLLLWLALPQHGRRLGQASLRAPNWLDLPLDRSEALAALRHLGWRIAPVRATICHWSGYLRPGVWRLYEALLLRPRETPLALFRDALAPARAAPAGREATSVAMRPPPRSVGRASPLRGNDRGSPCQPDQQPSTRPSGDQVRRGPTTLGAGAAPG